MDGWGRFAAHSRFLIKWPVKVLVAIASKVAWPTLHLCLSSGGSEIGRKAPVPTILLGDHCQLLFIFIYFWGQLLFICLFRFHSIVFPSYYFFVSNFPLGAELKGQCIYQEMSTQVVDLGSIPSYFHHILLLGVNYCLFVYLGSISSYFHQITSW